MDKRQFLSAAAVAASLPAQAVAAPKAATGGGPVLTVSGAIGKSNRGPFDPALDQLMKKHAILINTCRGPVVDEQALIAALQSGRILGAGLDVTSVDPIPGDSPLWDLPNTIITPHIATESVKLSDAVVDFWCENLRRFAEDRPLLGVVDPQAGY